MEMNSRPIQYAEKEFFSSFSEGSTTDDVLLLKWPYRPVPVVAIVTKFDAFVQDVQQRMEEAAEEEGKEVDDDENEIEKQAAEEAMVQFEQHYKQPLDSLPFPPRAVVTLSEGNVPLSRSVWLILTILIPVHKSTPDNSRLARLIQATMDALAKTESDLQRKQYELYDLSTFFSTAQNAATKTKLTTSASCVNSIESLIQFNPVFGCLEMGCNVREHLGWHLF
jgi:hypothetical protein